MPPCVTGRELTGRRKLLPMADDGLPADLRARVEAGAAELKAQREQDRFFVCSVCGQRVDREDFRAVLYHDEKPHQPR